MNEQQTTLMTVPLTLHREITDTDYRIALQLWQTPQNVTYTIPPLNSC